MQSDSSESLCLQAHFQILNCLLSLHKKIHIFFQDFSTFCPFMSLSLITPGTACVPPPTCWVTHSGLASWSTFPVESYRIRMLRGATLLSRRTRSPTSSSARKTTLSTTTTVRPQCEKINHTQRGFVHQKHFS